MATTVCVPDSPFRVTVSDAPNVMPSMDPTSSVTSAETRTWSRSSDRGDACRLVDGHPKEVAFAANDLTGVDADPHGVWLVTRCLPDLQRGPDGCSCRAECEH
jgi:hypothetical protein